MIVFYASHAGAFVDFAADVAFMLGLPIDTIKLDEQFDALVGHIRSSGLDDVSSVNQAIGILIGQGHSIDEARRDLSERADRAQISGSEAARRLIASVIGVPKAQS